MNSRRADFMIALALALGALGLRVAGIGQESFFFDEAQSYEAVRGSVWEHISHVELTPPLYFWLLKAWAFLCGVSHECLRLFSALAGATAVSLLWLALRAFGMRRAASLTAALLLVIAPPAIWYGQQARAYALFMLVVGGWLLAIALTARNPAKHNRVLLACVVLVGQYVHYYFALIVTAGMTGAYVAAGLQKVRPRVGALAQSHAAGMLGWLPLLPLVRMQTQSQAFWMPPPEWVELPQVFTQAFLVGPFHDASTLTRAAMGTLALALVGASLVTRYGKKKDTALQGDKIGRNQSPFTYQYNTAELRQLLLAVSLGGLTGGILVPFILAKFGMMGFLRDRYTVGTLPLFFAAIAVVTDMISCPGIRRAMLVLTLLLLVPPMLRADLDYWSRYQEFDWRGAVRLIDKEFAANDALMFIPVWMEKTFRQNGGNIHNRLSVEDALQGGRPAGAVWLFNWEQVPESELRDLVQDLQQQAGAQLRIDFPHIRLWKISRSSD